MKKYQWLDNLMSLEVLLQTEKKTTSDTLNLRDEDSIEINNLINIFFRLSYNCREDVQLDSEKHWFISIATSIYIRLPYNIRAIYILWLRGYYLEAMIVYRQILEGLPTLRYFHKYPDKIKKHIEGTRRVHFSAIFNEFSPGFYKNWYGETFSALTHGGFIANLLRFKRSLSLRETIMGCEFNSEKSNLVTVPTILISYGYLSFTCIFSPSINSKLNSMMKNRIKDISEHIERKYLKQSDNDFL